MNIDKEFLLKHRFWLMLAATPLFILVALVMLFTSVAGAVATQQETVEKAKKELQSIKDPKNQGAIDALQAVDTKIADKKNAVWARAWNMQQGLVTWPAALYPKMKDKYFGDDINHFDRGDYADNHYRTQLRADLYDIVNPYDATKPEQTAVQFRGGIAGWESIIAPIRQWAVKPPTNEDVWLAQEDIWVKRELLRVVKTANELVAVFRGPKPPEKGKAPPKVGAGEEIVDRQVFHNPDWELDLVLTRGAQNKHFLRGSLKNVGKKRHPLGIYLAVSLQRGYNVRPCYLMVDGDPLGVGDAVEVSFQDEKRTLLNVDLFNPSGLYRVEQVFNWRSVPVKRIDVVQLGYSAHRVANRTLKPYPGFAPKVDPNAPDATAGAMPSMSMPGGGSMSMPGGGMGSGEGGEGMGGRGGMGMGMGAPANVTANGLLKNRYIEVTPAVRRLPVALVLIVDQHHVQEVLTAFANSKLRIQTTQVHWDRSYENVRPPEEAATMETAGGSTPGMGGRGATGDTGSSEGPGGGRGMASGGGRAMGGGKAGGFGSMGGGPGGGYPGLGGMGSGMGSLLNMEEEEDMNLVEMSLYGIASLYEKYPPKAPPAEGGATPPPEGTPGATPPATTAPATQAGATPPAATAPPTQAGKTPPATTDPATQAGNTPATPATPQGTAGTPPAGQTPPATGGTPQPGTPSGQAAPMPPAAPTNPPGVPPTGNATPGKN